MKISDLPLHLPIEQWPKEMQDWYKNLVDQVAVYGAAAVDINVNEDAKTVEVKILERIETLTKEIEEIDKRTKCTI